MNHTPFIIELKMLARAKPDPVPHHTGDIAAPQMYRAEMPLEEYRKLKRLQKAVEDYEF